MMPCPIRLGLVLELFVIGTLLLLIFIPHHRYVFFLKWLTLSLLA